MCLNPSVTFRHPNLPNLESNILVDGNGHAHLAGFCLLMIASSDELSDISSFGGYGTARWMSPELIEPGRFNLEGHPTKASDCYALGLVIYEVLSGQIPFTESSDIAAIAKVLKGERPRRPQGMEGKLFTNNIWDTLKLCWKEQPRDRIDASAVLLRLEKHPPLPIPPPNLDGDAKTGSGIERTSGSNGQSYISDHDRLNTDSGMIYPSYPGHIFNYPCATIGLPIAHCDKELPLPPQTDNPIKERLLVRIRETFETVTKKSHGH